jgi:hypothetical protein
MKITNKIIPLLLLVASFISSGCKKYLDAKPDKKLAVISTLEELQSLLDEYAYMNMRDVVAGEMSSDDYYITDNDYNIVYSEFQNRTYIWEPKFLFSPISNDWYNIYRCVYRANTVLDNMSAVDYDENPVAWKDIKGQALYYRAHSFLQAAFIWTVAYDSATANEDMGLPLRLNSDFNAPSARSNLKDTYDRIISDLKEAITLLPTTTIHKMRPSKPAAYGLLARNYLSMRAYAKAGAYADSCLQLYNTLIDYNNPNLVSVSGAYAFKRFNDEVLTVSGMEIPELLANDIARIDSVLYRSYSDNDMRKIIFFRNNNDGTFGFRGSYERGSSLFSSVATDEMYLIRAESFARQGNIKDAMDDLDSLLIKRLKTGAFEPITAADQNDALKKILTERRKELLMRGLRWMDIKRLNKEGANISLMRIVNGNTYILPPNDKRFALPIPEDVIQMSGIQQNP